MRIIILLIVTTILWGSTPILEKIGLKTTGPLTGVTIRSIAVTNFLLIYLLVAGQLKQVFSTDIKTIAIFAATGLMAGLLGMLTYFGALKLGAASEIVPIAATYPLVTVILSILILGEHVSLWRIVGTVFIIAGVWLVQIK